MRSTPLSAVVLTAATATVNQITPAKDITTSPKVVKRQPRVSEVDGQKAGTGGRIIPFAELTGGTETVRCITMDKKTYMSIRDLIMVVCKKDKDGAGRVWRDLKNPFKEELRHFFLSNFQFPGQGETNGPVITLKGALKLIEWLPGENAKEY